MTAASIAEVLHTNWQGFESGAALTHVSIDSRSLQNGAHTVFFALIGPNNDGHRFIGELIGKGVTHFVVSQPPHKWLEQATFLVVGNTLDALQKLAGHHRGRFRFPVIGITGSNGKTIVKEWLNFLLSPDYNIARSPKSYNSQVGVPLSVLSINETHNLAIFEAGISTTGEMEKLEKIIRPDIGILTNIGPAHEEGFASEDEKISEKLKLFARSGVLICRKDPRVGKLVPENLRTFTWSFEDKSADALVTATKGAHETALDIACGNVFSAFTIPFTDSASIENAVTCLMVLRYLNYPEDSIRERLSQLYPVNMRLMVKNGVNRTTIIDDSYSLDLQSLRIALDFLESQKQQKRKTVILSDMAQAGADAYNDAVTLLTSNKIDRIIAIGENISLLKNKIRNVITYDSTQKFLTQFNPDDFADETILIKGAREFRFEEIVALLEEKTHETILEINLNAIAHNLNFYRSKLSDKTKMMAMVKAFSYGNGGFEVALLLEHHKIDYLGVAFADEGIALKSAGIKVPIMVMNPESTSFRAIIQYKLEPEIYNLKGLRAFISLAEAENLQHYPIHIKIDTGMHRLGFEEAQLAELISTLRRHSCVSVKSVLSHMATSDDLQHHEFALEQIALFERLSAALTGALDIDPIRHMLNTSGIEHYPAAQYDMVRLGIGLYGVSNDPAEQPHLELVGTLKSVISQKRTISAGESVGYGRRFIAEKTSDIATIPIGYADGISRHWGNGNGYVTINGKPAPIVGSVCMDMLMADCTGINCSEGDAVVIFGEKPSVIEMADALGTIPYEIMTSISQRVKRVFFRE